MIDAARPVRLAGLAAALLTLGFLGAPASAQPLVVTVRPPAAPTAFALEEPYLPNAVLSGAGYGFSGYGYYFDEPSEHLLGRRRPERRVVR